MKPIPRQYGVFFGRDISSLLTGMIVVCIPLSEHPPSYRGYKGKEWSSKPQLGAGSSSATFSWYRTQDQRPKCFAKILGWHEIPIKYVYIYIQKGGWGGWRRAAPTPMVSRYIYIHIYIYMYIYIYIYWWPLYSQISWVYALWLFNRAMEAIAYQIADLWMIYDDLPIILMEMIHFATLNHKRGYHRHSCCLNSIQSHYINSVNPYRFHSISVSFSW